MHAPVLGSEFVIRFNKLVEPIYYSIFVAYSGRHRLSPTILICWTKQLHWKGLVPENTTDHEKKRKQQKKRENNAEDQVSEELEMIQLLNSKSQIDVLCNPGVQSYLKICKSLILKKTDCIHGKAKQQLDNMKEEKTKARQGW